MIGTAAEVAGKNMPPNENNSNKLIKSSFAAVLVGRKLRRVDRF